MAASFYRQSNQSTAHFADTEDDELLINEKLDLSAHYLTMRNYERRLKRWIAVLSGLLVIACALLYLAVTRTPSSGQSVTLPSSGRRSCARVT